MLNFFDTIVNFFGMIFEFIRNMVMSTITLLQVLSEMVLIPPILRGFVPSFIGVSIVVVTAIGAIKLILGWGNS